MSSENQTVSGRIRQIPAPILVMVALGVLAISTSVWAVRSQSEVMSLENELAEVRANANASVFDLERTENAPTAAQGQVFIRVSGSGVVIISNLPQPGDNEEYRLWYLEDETVRSGGPVTVDANGQGFALIPGDSGHYSQIAVSLEAEGTDTPTTSYLLVADVRSGRG